jgi:large subunit ribosomal protein L19
MFKALRRNKSRNGGVSFDLYCLKKYHYRNVWNYLGGFKKMDALKLISQDSLKAETPELNIGDTVKVHVRIKEGDKYRIQIFEGTIIAKKHGGINETFTVRRVAHGCGIERVFPVHSPIVDKVEIVRKGKVRRAKLYYLRDRVGKAAKVKEAIR